jgi:hypothetical protein
MKKRAHSRLENPVKQGNVWNRTNIVLMADAHTVKTINAAPFLQRHTEGIGQVTASCITLPLYARYGFPIPPSYIVQ